jgi:Domain of unknown function (DUF5666)
MKGKWIALIVVALIVVAAAAAFGGYTTGVNAGKTQALAARDAFFAARGIGSGQGGGAFTGQGGNGGQNGGQQFNPNNFAAGQVKQIDGNTIQLSTAQAVVTVKVSDQTQIQKMGSGSLGDIQTGERITVQGTRGADGVMTAQSIQIGGAFRGGGPNGQPTPGGATGASASNRTN